MAAILAACISASLAPAAGATLRVEIAGDGGLVMTDKEGYYNDVVVLGLVQNATGLEWTVSRRCTSCIDPFTFDIGPGCREEGFTARCGRLAGKATANLRGGNDNFSVASGLGITDPLTINLADVPSISDNVPRPDDDVAFGGQGHDQIIGGAGNDTLHDGQGNDSMDGGAGNDSLRLSLGADTAHGGSGNDSIVFQENSKDDRDEVNGGIGFDKAAYPGRGTALRIIEANLETLGGEKDAGENDVLRSIESYGGGFGNDIITGAVSSNPSNYSGEQGNDTIFGSSGNNTLTGGLGNDQLDGNAGDDVLDAKTGEGNVAVADPVIDCGDGTNDRAILDLQDDQTPANCDQNISRSAAGEGPHVRMRFGRRVRISRGRVRVKLSCPRKLRHRCKGTLEVRIGKRRSARTRYSVRHGKSKRVSVRLGGLSRRVGRRRAAAIVSLERGDVRGVKTTSRRIVLRR